MNKRIIALVMALVLCLASTAALAANSKTTYDIITTDSPVITVAAPTAESKAELDAIAKFVNDGQPVVTYFYEAVQTSIAASLPAGIDASTLKMDEFFALSSTGSMTVGTSMTLSTAAVYAAGDAVITLGGIVKDDKVEWQVLPSTVVDGKIVVQLPAAFAASVADGSVMLAVLSNAN